MPVYEEYVWHDGNLGGTAVSAANLNTIEGRTRAAFDAIEALISASSVSGNIQFTTTKTGDYPLAAADNGKIVPFDSASARQCLLPPDVDMAAGWSVQVSCWGDGGVTVVEDPAVTLVPVGLRTIARDESVIITKRPGAGFTFEVEQGPQGTGAGGAVDTTGNNAWTGNNTFAAILRHDGPPGSLILFDGTPVYWGVDQLASALDAAFPTAPVGSLYFAIPTDGGVPRFVARKTA